MIPLLVALALGQAAPKGELVPGKFGKALDAARTPLAFTGDGRYRTPPLSVECWVKLGGKVDFNVFVSNDPKDSARHWELYSYARTGFLSAYLPGYAPSEIVSKTNVTDGKWRFVAMTFDGKEVRLFADGKEVHRQEVKPAGKLKAKDGPLGIGQAILGDLRVGCDGLIDDVRLSRVIRPATLPKEPLPLDADTIALWRFDGSDRVLADPAWTPPPRLAGEPWERMTDVDWIDPRLRKMDTGLTFNACFAYEVGLFDDDGRKELGKKRVEVYRGTAVKVGDGTALFDRGALQMPASWEGWVKHSDRRFGLLNTPTPAGKVSSSIGEKAESMPSKRGRYRGMYLHGDRVVFSYTLDGAEVLLSPLSQTLGGRRVVACDVEVGPHEGKAKLSFPMVRYALPASKEVERFRLAGTEFLGDGKKSDLAALKKPGPARWTKTIVTKGEVAKNTAPYVVDTLTLPYDNPYNALFFCTGLDFLPDGRIAMCTAHGDVWLAKADADLGRIEWKRFATGLYQPLGLKVVAGKIVVLERGQLTRLHDYNNDGEADFYENICNDWHIGSGEHSYDTCLETDADGNFYFFKTGDTHLPHGGCLMRVDKDGKAAEVYATGFRHPIGLSVSPTGQVTGADQEGNWMPMTRVDWYKKGGFYGDMRAHHRKTAPTTYDLPLMWLPKIVDNSAGGQAWTIDDKFGLPKGRMLHLSYGRCKLYSALTQEVDGVTQGAAADLGVTFLSGSARGRFSEKDGALYVCGLNGWQTAAKRDGCLQRVRYTGLTPKQPTGWAAYEDGIRLDFATKLDAARAAKGWEVAIWNYRWSGDYGSKDWSVADPNRRGRDALEIESAALGKDGRSVFVKVKGLRPAMQVRVGYDIADAAGDRLSGSIHGTIHRLAPAAKREP